MILIAHRGNLNGPGHHENSPSYVAECIVFGVDCEVDVWERRGKLFLGHDRPMHEITDKFLDVCAGKLWCHAKNIEALRTLRRLELTYFWHQTDAVAVTSRGYWWYYPSDRAQKDGINVLPELHGLKASNLKGCEGICSDYILKYKRALERP